jgi:CarD family transcriptional regulator
MFKVGEKVVYPAHGVGEIEAIRIHVISGSERKFYMLRILETDMKIMIPIENVDSVGLRKVIDRAMVSKVYKVLRQKKVETDQQTWNRRYREYTEKIKTGSILEIAKVLRDLFVLKGDKELSFGECDSNYSCGRRRTPGRSRHKQSIPSDWRPSSFASDIGPIFSRQESQQRDRCDCRTGFGPLSILARQ